MFLFTFYTFIVNDTAQCTVYAIYKVIEKLNPALILNRIPDC